MSKSFSITIHPDPLAGEFLTVSDALSQVLDLIEVLERSEAADPRERKILWRLAKAHTNSPPFTLVAEPSPAKPSLSIDSEAEKISRVLGGDVKRLLDGEVGGVVAGAKSALKRMIERNITTIARTEFAFSDGEVFSIGPQNARTAMAAIERAEVAERENRTDWKRTEFGTVEGEIVGLTRWYGKPAFNAIERLSEKWFTCVLPDQLSQKIGPAHSWSEVWEGRRVNVTGALHYDSDGDLKRADVEDFEDVPWTDLSVGDLKGLDVLGEKSMSEHLDHLRGEASG